ncbi:uncharacterized protein LOC111268244 isoform X2 [Varroa jacobsoni]|uniref:Uncharacterized protein n=1 Tax=Varroa destructor TaxID=109461 RepID=A0A7M7MBN0_VARDE|nr:uncharacterized protein LOC111245734 isoform X2 [Varroa destructor]XP_022702840.1 uncharacterized protein LOC111268244 isoform X2 [Varroa jacobsoni]
MTTLNNFNFSRPRCADSLPRVPPYNENIHVQPLYPQATGCMPPGCTPVAPGLTEYTEIENRLRSTDQGGRRSGTQTLGRSVTAGTIFGVYGVSSDTATSAHVGVTRGSTLGAQGRSTTRWSTMAKRSSLGHALFLDKGGNALDDFYRGIDIKPSRCIVGRQTSARPHHVCYSLQCPCQPASSSVSIASRAGAPTAPTIATISDNLPPSVSAYYTRQVQPQGPMQQETPTASFDLERFRRPVESPALSESHSSLASSQQQQQLHHGQPSPAQQKLNNSGPHRKDGYHDLEETSSESSSTRIPSRMSGDPNVTTSTENDTRQLMKGGSDNPANSPPPPYSAYCAVPSLTTTTTTTLIQHAILPNKEERLYSKLPPSSRQTLVRAVQCSAALIVLLTALCILVLVASRGGDEGGRATLHSDDFFGDSMSNRIGPGALAVVPAPTDLVDRSQVIIVNRRNPTQSAEQAAQLSDLLTLVGAYNATTQDAAFPSQLIQTVQPGCTMEEQFGYRRGEPCVAIVLRPNPVFVPVLLLEAAGASDVTDRSSNLLELQCLCENRRSVKIAYLPFRGFPLRFFPRSARASPLLVMLRFEDLPLKTELRISCGLRGAQNVDTRSDRVNFQIMVI